MSSTFFLKVGFDSGGGRIWDYPPRPGSLAARAAKFSCLLQPANQNPPRSIRRLAISFKHFDNEPFNPTDLTTNSYVGLANATWL